jgi:hypothetical protein
MAWISVHEQVLGMKLRDLSKAIGCSQKEALGILVSLWLWGINNADSEGILKSADKNDIAGALSTGLSTGLSENNVVECLIDKHWIDEKEGAFILHDWDIWQEQWYKALNRRTYDASRKRDERKNQKYVRPLDNPQDSPQESPVQPSPLPSPTYNYIDNIKKSDTSRMTFSGNVYLSVEEHSSLCHKFNSKDSALQVNHYITQLSEMKSDGYQSENDFAEILKLIESGQ